MNANSSLRVFESKETILPDAWHRNKPTWNQVHGVQCVEVTASGQSCGDADALWTRVPGQWVGVRAADCVPILLEYRKNAKVESVGAIHAGWRGTYAHILEHFFNSMPTEISDLEHWRVWMGPSNRACCYEVSPELIEQFGAEFPQIPLSQIEPKHRHLDLIAVNRAELIRLGMPSENIEVHPDCTFCAMKSDRKEEKYLSYRRGDRMTRQHSVISF